ncbi:hypothetical protein HOY82DRAFT_601653 [Tuber indicum]|nr:hypothetical protein HOY82DRAFT_601653 [Tuber indicum]
MIHALVQLPSELGVDKRWYIPQADVEASLITETNHNILQGVANSEVRFVADKHALLNKWIRRSAERYWLSPGGPPAPGVVVIDDPQMPVLIPLIKSARPEFTSIYRSHMEVRNDPVERVGSP